MKVLGLRMERWLLSPREEGCQRRKGGRVPRTLFHSRREPKAKRLP